MNVVELARAGENRRCIVCADLPFGGGLRCLPCFQARARENAGEHRASERPSYATYASGCRCRACKRESAEYTRRRRAQNR